MHKVRRLLADAITRHDMYIALFPDPHPVFHCLQYSRVGEGLENFITRVTSMES